VFVKLGLNDHLTPQRSNGLASMVARIKRDALATSGTETISSKFLSNVA
jgi:cysteine desulfuration protein SufE